MARKGRVRDKRPDTKVLEQDDKKRARYNEEEKKAPARRRLRKNHVPAEDRVAATAPSHDQDFDTTHEEMRQQAPLCCYKCRCGPGKKSKQWQSSGEGKVWHRMCCHGQTVKNEDWAGPAETALHGVTIHDEEWGGFRLVSADDIVKRVHLAHKQESEIYNADETRNFCLESVQSALPQYHEKVRQPYNRLIGGQTRRGGCNVLELFSSIGTGLLVIKRLKIAVKKVVRVEHDRVSDHVYRYNHDPSYNGALDQGKIEHLIIRKFEKLEEDGKLEELMNRVGHFDLVIGGPPCSDYSGVKSHVEGTSGANGRYLPAVGKLIRRIQELQKGHHLFYMIENVKINDKNAISEIKDAFGMAHGPLEFDAKYVSPCARNRLYFTNIPLDEKRFLTDDPASNVGPASCLEEGFFHPAKIPTLPQSNMIVKSHCHMASKAKIDDCPRTFVFREEKHRDNDGTLWFRGRPMTVGEREKQMGFREGYVGKPIELLFNQLNIAMQYTDEGGVHWKKSLDKRFHCFAGNYHELPGHNWFDCRLVSGDDLGLKIRLAPPRNKKTSHPSHFDENEYAKRLVGLAFSVPVVERILAPLQNVFRRREYTGFDYKFAWENASNDDSDPGVL